MRPRRKFYSPVCSFTNAWILSTKRRRLATYFGDDLSSEIEILCIYLKSCKYYILVWEHNVLPFKGSTCIQKIGQFSSKTAIVGQSETAVLKNCYHRTD